MTGLAAAAAVILAAVSFIAVRRRSLARIALRSAARRKGETALVILGSLLGTAIITGSLIVGDTLDASLRAVGETALGPTDLMVRTADDEAGERTRAALEGFQSDDVDGILPIRTAVAPVATPGTDDRLAHPTTTLIEVDFAAAAAFGGDPSATGISGTTPPDGHTVITENLAADLDVEPGDTIVVYAYGVETPLVVDDTLPRLGVAGLDVARNPLTLEFPRNVFVAPGLLDELAADVPAAAAAKAQPPRDVVLVSATGGVYEGVDRTQTVTTQLREALGGFEGVQIEPVKRDVLDDAEEEGDSFRELFITIGSFAVIAGLLLLVNIFVMLAEERKSELGMLRAIGLKRRDLVRIFVIEGSLYAVAAAVVGALLGIVVGRIIIVVTSGIFESFGDLSLTFSAPASSIITGGLVGFLISMSTIIATSVRNSRLNIIRAIRDLPEPTGRRPRRVVTVLQVLALVVFAGLAAVSIRNEDLMGGLAFPALAGLALAALLSRVWPRRLVVSLIAVGLLVWAIFAEEFATFSGGDVNVFIVQGVVLTAAAVALASQNQDAIGAFIRRLGGNGSLVARIGLAYPLARRFRTSMTLAMYSLVVFTLVFISVLSHILGTLTDKTVADEGGGYEILASMSPTNPVEQAQLQQVEGVADVATMIVGQAQYKRPFDEDFSVWGIGGVNEELIDGGPPRLDEWAPEYGSADAAWRAVASDASLMIADAFFLQDQGGPPEASVEVGDTVEIRDPTTGEVSARTVAAISAAGQSLTAWMSEESVRDAVVQVAPTRAYVAVEEGADATAVALRLQGEFIVNGLQADSFRDIAVEQTRVNTQFFRLMQGFLALGLVVGIAGLGVIMVRAVRERRREIGMLRSLGFQSRMVRSAFLLESGFVALEGMIIGTALSLITSYQLVLESDIFGEIDVPFSAPWLQLALLLGIALLASLLATAGPAHQAAKIKPAVALRIAD